MHESSSYPTKLKRTTHIAIQHTKENMPTHQSGSFKSTFLLIILLRTARLIIGEAKNINADTNHNPNKIYTAKLKEHGITVVHVVSSVKFALKAEEAGVTTYLGPRGRTMGGRDLAQGGRGMGKGGRQMNNMQPGYEYGNRGNW